MENQYTLVIEFVDTTGINRLYTNSTRHSCVSAMCVEFLDISSYEILKYKTSSGACTYSDTLTTMLVTHHVIVMYRAVSVSQCDRIRVLRVIHSFHSGKKMTK